MSFPITWTAERNDALKTLLEAPERWSAEAVSSIISRQFGFRISRNSVIGKAARLGIPLNNNRVGVKPKPKSKLEQMSFTPRPDPRPGQVPLLELAHDGCRYPNGDSVPYLFCNQPTSDGSYCAGHAAICFNPAKPGTRPSFQHRRRT